MQSDRAKPWTFFLGGNDLEMATIRELLKARQMQSVDKGLPWGARASAYAPEIAGALASGRIPVLIELIDDVSFDPHPIVSIDHHGPKAGKDRPTSLEQVFELLNLSPSDWTRRQALVSANDKGYIPAMLELEPPASREEIEDIRAADRFAQGVTLQEETQAALAIRNAVVHANGLLTVVCSPHDRTSPVADRMEPMLGGSGYKNLLILTPQGNHFFGDGGIVTRLAESYPDSWYGGALPKQGFWGSATLVPNLLDTLKNWIEAV